MRVTQHKFTQTPREVHQVRLTTAKNLILFNVREKALEQRGRVCDLFPMVIIHFYLLTVF